MNPSLPEFMRRLLPYLVLIGSFTIINIQIMNAGLMNSFTLSAILATVVSRFFGHMNITVAAIIIVTLSGLPLIFMIGLDMHVQGPMPDVYTNRYSSLAAVLYPAIAVIITLFLINRLLGKYGMSSVILLCGSLAVVAMILYTFEYLVKISDPANSLPHNGYIKNVYYTWGHSVHINSHGFRDSEIDMPKPVDTFRVLVLGDSLTWGTGLSLPERYTDIVENRLQESIKSTHIDVVNMAKPGIPTVYQRGILYTYADQLSPDLIVVGFCINDTQRRMVTYSVERSQFQKTYMKYIRILTDSMKTIGLKRIAGMIQDAIVNTATRVGILPTWQESLQRTYEPDSPEWKEFVGSLKDIKQKSDELGLDDPVFLLLNQGTYTDRPTNYADPDHELQRYLQWYRRAGQAAKRAGFIVYSFENEIAERLSGEILSVNVMDGHPSARLNELYAEKLIAHIERLNDN
jgi:lysophospholipase L1-like esterase